MALVINLFLEVCAEGQASHTAEFTLCTSTTKLSLQFYRSIVIYTVTIGQYANKNSQASVYVGKLSKKNLKTVKQAAI